MITSSIPDSLRIFRLSISRLKAASDLSSLCLPSIFSRAAQTLTSTSLARWRRVLLLPLCASLIYEFLLAVVLVLCGSGLITRGNRGLVGEAVEDTEDERTPAEDLAKFLSASSCLEAKHGPMPCGQAQRERLAYVHPRGGHCAGSGRAEKGSMARWN